MRVVRENRWNEQMLSKTKHSNASPLPRATIRVLCYEALVCGKPEPGLHKGKTPGITSPKCHQRFSSMRGYMTRQQDHIPNNRTNSAALYPLLMIRLVLE